LQRIKYHLFILHRYFTAVHSTSVKFMIVVLVCFIGRMQYTPTCVVVVAQCLRHYNYIFISLIPFMEWLI